MIAWFAKNDVAANLLMVAIFVAGIGLAITRLPLEVFPEADIDTITVSVAFRGSTPGEVEEGILIAIEESIQDIEAIDRITSSAIEGGGTVSLLLRAGYDARAALNDIKSRVDAIATFPVDAERPLVALQARSDTVIRVVVAGHLPETELRRVTDQVREDILSLVAETPEEFRFRLGPVPLRIPVPDFLRKTERISSAEVVGARPYEIAIEVSEANLRRYDITLDEVAAAVTAQSVDLSGGTLRTGAGEILLRTRTKAYTGPEFSRIVVRANPDGTMVRIGDLGLVRDGFEENVVEGRFNGKPAMVVAVNRLGGQNALLISNAVKRHVEARQGSLGNDIDLVAWRDRSSIVKSRLDTLVRNLVGAFCFVFVVLALFLRLPLAGWTVLGIPLCFAGGLIVLSLLGATLNISSLFGFILVLGIVVDDAIVIGENIHRKLEQGLEGTQAAIEGAREVSLPVIFGVLTTMAAFIPLSTMPGMRGAMFVPIAMVVIPVLFFSLVESQLILPSHLKHMRRPDDRKPASWNPIPKAQAGVTRALDLFIRRVYQPVLELCLRNRGVAACGFLAVLLFTLGWCQSGRIIFLPFPRVASDSITARLVMPAGTPHEITAGHIRRLEEAAMVLQEKYRGADGQSVITGIFSTSGGQGSGSNRGTVASGQSNLGEISFDLVEREGRATRGMTADARSLSMEYRQMVGPIPGAEEFNIRAEHGRFGDPIDVQLSGGEPAVLALASGAVEEKLKEFVGLFDIMTNVDNGKEEIRLRVSPSAQLLGVGAEQLSRQTRGAFFGYEAQRLQRGRDDVRVMVRYPEEERRSLAFLGLMGVRSPDGARVPLANLAELEYTRSPARITRIDRARVVNVLADADKMTVDLGAIKESLAASLPGVLADYPGVRFSLEGEAREEREAQRALIAGCVVVLFLIYCLLAIPLKSFLQPLVVMAAIPFGLVGAAWGHAWLGQPLSFMSLFGLLALAGVAVNDSLVLVDWVNRRRADGTAVQEAVRQAGAARFRAIILTSLTTFSGLVPLIFFEQSTQAQYLIPMAISLAFGILFTTGITLFLVPVLFLLLEDAQRLLVLGWQWFRHPFAPPGTKSLPA